MPSKELAVSGHPFESKTMKLRGQHRGGGCGCGGLRLRDQRPRPEPPRASRSRSASAFPPPGTGASSCFGRAEAASRSTRTRAAGLKWHPECHLRTSPCRRTCGSRGRRPVPPLATSSSASTRSRLSVPTRRRGATGAR